MRRLRVGKSKNLIAEEGLDITLTIDQGSYFKSQLELAQHLNRDSRFAVTIYFTLRYPGDEMHHLQVKNLNIQYVLPEQSSRLELRTFPMTNSMVTLVNTWRRYYRAKREWVGHITFQKPFIVILPAENRYLQNLHSHVCGKLHVPVVVVPLWVAGKEELIEASIGTHSSWKKTIVEHLVGLLLPKYSERRDYDSKIILATSWDEIICQLLFRCAPKLPWTLHDGNSTVIAVESQKMSELASASGIDPNKVVVVGSIFHDRMFAKIHQPSDRPQLADMQGLIHILVAIPPDMFYVRGAKGLEYANYEQLIDHWTDFLESLTDVKITYCLHPSSSYGPTFASRGLQVAINPIEDLIPVHDLYVASISATIQWALAAGLEVIDFDVYRYCYPSYLLEEKVQTCLFKDEFETSVRLSVESLKLRAAKQPRPDWGVLDGLAGIRITDLLLDLIKHC